MLVSPSESPAFRALGTSTWRTEDFGMDAMWVARGCTYGVQRKTVLDLVASVEDGRISKEVMQWLGVDFPVLMLETGERGGGSPREMGGVVHGTADWGRGWTGGQLRSHLWTLRTRGVHVECVRDEAETIERIKELEAWSKKDRHTSLMVRGKAPGNVFGVRGNREYAMWLLMGLPGVGPEMAGRLVDEFADIGGVMVLNERVGGVEGLTRVKGVGKVTAKKIVEILGTERWTTHESHQPS